MVTVKHVGQSWNCKINQNKLHILPFCKVSRYVVKWVCYHVLKMEGKMLSFPNSIAKQKMQCSTDLRCVRWPGIPYFGEKNNQLDHEKRKTAAGSESVQMSFI